MTSILKAFAFYIVFMQLGYHHLVDLGIEPLIGLEPVTHRDRKGDDKLTVGDKRQDVFD